MNTADFLVQFLIKQDITKVFGYPGGAALPLYDAFARSKIIDHYMLHNEQSVVHAAQGYARSTNKTGVVISTSGPGATNTITGIADAKLDSIPLVVITSQVKSELIGKDAFQEVDIISMTKSITKKNFFVSTKEEMYPALFEAFKVANEGRKGPVLIDIPKDIYDAEYTENEINLTKYTTQESEINEQQINTMVQMIKDSKKPVIYCGGGVARSGSENLLRQFVKLTNFPVTNTTMGIGNISSDCPQYLKMLGMHGTCEANNAMHDCDLMLAFGVRFDDRITGLLSKFSPNSKKIHIDIDSKELNKNITVDIAVNGNIKDYLLALNNKLLRIISEKQAITSNLDSWWNQINQWRSKDSFAYNQEINDEILPQYVLDQLFKQSYSLKPFVTTDVGQHQMWAAQYYLPNKPQHFISSCGLGTMGFGLPAAIGVQITNPDDITICITGEGSFMMSMPDLGAIKKYNLPVKILILNNGSLGMVQQWQEMFYGNRHYQIQLDDMIPDFQKLAESFGINSSRVNNAIEVESKISEMLECKKSPYLLEIMVKNCHVLPMIAPGKAHNEIIF